MRYRVATFLEKGIHVVLVTGGMYGLNLFDRGSFSRRLCFWSRFSDGRIHRTA
jgi:hypothetical protein